MKEETIKPKEKNLGDSDQEMLNLEKELHSLTHYADEPEELVAQMFSTIKGPKLNAMLPPILKEIPQIDVQQLCLHELRGMSARRILSIINGVEMSDSSSEEDDLLDSKTPKTEEAEGKQIKEELSESMDFDASSLKDIKSMVDDPNLTEMDVKELEMRAKLIKTMLNKQPGETNGEAEEEEDKVEYDPNIKIKEEPLSTDEETKKKKSKHGKYRERSCSSSSSSNSSNSSSSSSRSHSSSSNSSSDNEKISPRVNGEREVEGHKKRNKKITKEEFQARMKKAKMNRSYRKRTESDEGSADDSKKRRRKKKKSVKQDEKEEVTNEATEIEANVADNLKIKEESDNKETLEYAAAVEEPKQTEEEKQEAEVIEKEEGEIDSNEEGNNDSDYSSKSSSRSYSRSPRRHRRKHKKRYSRRGRSKSPSVPKVPNWEASSKSALPKKASGDANTSQSLTEIRQSISFSLNKKSGSAAAPNLQDDSGVTKNTAVDSSSVLTNQETEQKPEVTAAVEGTEDFYKGADQLSFSEEEDGAIPADSDAEMQDTSLIETIQTAQDEGQNIAGKGTRASCVSQKNSVESTTLVRVKSEVGDENSQDEHEPAVDEDAAEHPQEGVSDNTEIIGVIDPTSSLSLETFDDNLSGSSWSTRWLQSEKVQQVVSDSKMLSKMRKNIQAKGKGTAKKVPVQQRGTPPPPVSDHKGDCTKEDKKPKKLPGGIGGNAEEYENVFGIKVKVPQSLPAPKAPKQTCDTQTKSKPLAITLIDSDDEGDDSEDDELWSKIMKK